MYKNQQLASKINHELIKCLSGVLPDYLQNYLVRITKNHKDITKYLSRIPPYLFRRILIHLFFVPQSELPKTRKEIVYQLYYFAVTKPPAILFILAGNCKLLKLPTSSDLSFAKIESYQRITQGNLWKNYHNKHLLRQGYLATNMPSVKQLSQLNLRRLKGQLGRLGSKERAFIKTIKALRFNLIYNTNALGYIKKSGALISNLRLKRAGLLGDISSSKVQNNTSDNDVRHLANDDCVFFRFTTQSGDVASRFGSTTFCLDPETYGLYEHGWISLYDMLAPIHDSLSGVQRLGRAHSSKKYLIRQSADEHIDPGYGSGFNPGALDSVTPGLRDKMLHVYSDEPNLRDTYIDHLAELVFYGPDILEGLAFALLREVKRMKLKEQNFIMSRCHIPAFMSKLVMKLFRTEAKLPGFVPVRTGNCSTLKKVDDFSSLASVAKPDVSAFEDDSKHSVIDWTLPDDDSSDSSDTEDVAGEMEIMQWLQIFRKRRNG